MTHQAKRPYNGSQPSITSYFPSSVSFNGQYNISPNPHHPSNEVCFPALPAGIQSSLINVGMRVRKSVPEGYKTSAYSAFALFAENTPMPAPEPVQKVPSKTRPRAGARELTPFCGILKVGGMAQQQWGIYNPGGGNQAHDGRIYADEEMDEEEDEAPLFGSQASEISTMGINTPLRENKRRFFEDDEEDSETTNQTFANRGLGERVMAVPRRKTWGGKEGPRARQNNVTVVGQDIDFEDAEFLDYGIAREVEMSG